MMVTGGQPAPTPETCLAYFLQRKDLSLGLLPQILLDERNAELWGYFWFAARAADDDIEHRYATSADYVQRLHRKEAQTPADAALQRFLESLPEPLDRDDVVEELEFALHALGRERSWSAPPRLLDYADVLKAKAATPLLLLNRLLLPGELEPHVKRFATLLAMSIQLGDDLRDRPRDAEAGLFTISQDELDAAGVSDLGDSDEAPRAIQKWREASCQRFALLALDAAEKITKPNRSKARMQVQLWLGAIATSQLEPSDEGVRWPYPLSGLLTEGLPSVAHLAEVRRIVHSTPRVMGDTARWDPPYRAELLAELKAKLPPPYLLLERYAMA